MKKTVLTAMVVLSICLVFIFVVESRAQRKRKPIPKKVSVLNLDEQAEKLARSFWMSRLNACDGDYFTRDAGYIHQFKNPTITTRMSSLTKADRLNGIEYLGVTTFIVDASRTYSHQSTSYQGVGWSRWSQGFTMAMGGIDLTAAVKRVKGKWLVIPNSISQAGNLQAVTCADAANPVAFYRRLEEESFSAEVKKFRANAESMGIYAHNIPPAMWKGMYEAGGLYGVRRYTTLGWAYLAQNGGWGASGRNGYRSDNLLSAENWQKVKGKWIEQVTKDGGYVLIRRDTYNYGQANPSYAGENISQSLLYQMGEYTKQNLGIKMVRIGYHDEWFLIAEDIGGRRAWSWINIPESAKEILNRLYGDYQRGKGGWIRDIVFLPNGGYVIVVGRNTYYAENVPPEAENTLKMLRDGNYEISQVTFGPEDSWIIRANGTW